jgi:SAM-dependent methyltransferase
MTITDAPDEDLRRAKVNEVWSADAARDTQELGRYWMAHPMVRDRVNRLASGRADRDAYGHLAELLRGRGWRLPVARALSIGCGFGALERGLVATNLVQRIEALDLAEGAILEARRLAAEAGYADRISYEVSDLESASFAPGFDIIFAHSSVHHVERLEELFAAVKRALRPGGLFHLNEFVGPTRFQWTDAQLALCNTLLDQLPDRLKRLPDGQTKPRIARPTVADMIAFDPSESVRSADIVPLMRAHFDVIEERRLGGAVLHLLLADIGQNFRPDDPQDCAAMQSLFDAEDAAMADGRIGSDFMTITAQLPEPATRPQSLSTRMSLLLPPVRRLHAALRETQEKVARLEADQARLAAEVARLARALDQRRG